MDDDPMGALDDRAVVSSQLGRPARAFRRVACRCAHGYPAVTEQEPRAEDGVPFPTTYWLTCPWLAAAVARIEAAGGVARWSRIAAEDPELAASLAAADAEQRRIRPELDVGIGGTRSPTRLKCLHAHAAFALARPGYTLGERILEEAGERWCPDARCAQYGGAAGSRSAGEMEGAGMITSARQQWDDGIRRLEAEAGDSVRYRQLCDLVDCVVDELRRRLGQHYTLAELAALHPGGEDWARPLIADVLPPESRVGVRDVALVVDAAFHVYTRGASDYRP